MKLGSIVKIIANLKFAIFLLILIAFFSSLGSFIEQDESISFYQTNYPNENPIYGFVDWKFLLFFGIDHIYKTWWFLILLVLLGGSLISCTILRQFPLFLISKDSFFRKEKKSFFNLSFFKKIKSISYAKEAILLKVELNQFSIYQQKNIIYAYKGLIGRISPILVHVSLLFILAGSSIGALKNLKAQELIPKGEIVHIQNPVSVGFLTSFPQLTIRVNDFWVEYKNNNIHQFYSNLSILDTFGIEKKNQTISVNNPLHYNNIDLYQSDWNLIGIRIKDYSSNKIYELPLFQLNKNGKIWGTWIQNSQRNNNNTLLFEKFENTCFLYSSKEGFIKQINLDEKINNDFFFVDVIPSTGLLIKYDPTIPLIYFGFGLLIITTFLSFFPYTQIWIFEEASFLRGKRKISRKQNKIIWFGGSTNRGQIQFEIEFENLIRFPDYFFQKTLFLDSSF